MPKLAEKSFIASETNTSSVLYFYISLLYSKTKQDTEKFVEVKTHISPKHVFFFFFSFFDFGFFLSFEFFLSLDCFDGKKEKQKTNDTWATSQYSISQFFFYLGCFLGEGTPQKNPKNPKSKKKSMNYELESRLKKN